MGSQLAALYSYRSLAAISVGGATPSIKKNVAYQNTTTVAVLNIPADAPYPQQQLLVCIVNVITMRFQEVVCVSKNIELQSNPIARGPLILCIKQKKNFS